MSSNKLKSTETCQICSTEFTSIKEFQHHAVESCIPFVLDYFGLSKTIFIELLEIQKKNEKLEEQIAALKLEAQRMSVKLEAKKKRKLSIGSTSCTFMDDDQSCHSLGSVTGTTSTSNSTAPMIFPVKEEMQPEALEHRVEYGSNTFDIEKGEEPSGCYLAQTLKLVSSTDNRHLEVFKCTGLLDIHLLVVQSGQLARRSCR
ncbi:hypothetical protein PPL_04221 [Heterostelium album PN500]|uniref:Uncharacterized protein n=1 Tax=Heterostelium pallidum (strain ATCC 26659 / Pp 5 / PN500) TaxID=670386 RepID=D3B6Z0_HETP5|nr:hypothetical protein PPL_04221 [Heterostelium album PN500]EFA82533.1 hypothetical protein PPL_04221 [Heterostelium album PN500]|eukprot:XP_020434650.1 hypothetical protein PPL_04221 [Heterostelium album PN500]